ncbi:alkaline phosphatase D [Enhydrobacter aerosaccus]|uniref:Alkaline phosphatase D n=1 Tax=Enhydrobacter aerosaccus TaxID=225324 RepID=A0A1T4NDR9_9HYPH|nr:alkaline phosphatase D family protein [Enhydrobacter aerosaccus]SJZ77206.1 alkaline phosphatase D [Enhydrobacter aerosaccus]
MYRRSFIGALGTLWLPSLARAQTPLADNPFGLGVASGHPTPQSVVLWTRLLAADPTEPLSGPVTVDWSVAEDERLQRVVRSGQAIAEPRWAHSVHVDVDGLESGRPYWYRFTVNGKASPIGRTLTAPAANAAVPMLRFAFASCQQYEQGYYSAHRHMAAEELNAVLFVGDYIYEVSWGRDLVRHHGSGRPTTLSEFRNRYALYKSDPDLRAAHAAHPWIVTWDDHEVANDYANDISPTDLDPQQFLLLRAAAYQAYWEHMPLPNAMQPQGSALRIYDRYRFGDLAELFVLDDRQYRAHNACHAELIRSRMLTDCAERLDPSRTMLGAEQEAWFADGMKTASGRWNLIAQQTLMAETGRTKDGKRSFWADGWDGYPAARQKLLDAVAASRVKDTVVMGGDVHSFWATDLKQDFASPSSRTVATEFVGGSITSQGFTDEQLQPTLKENPYIRYAHGGSYGYGHIAVEPKRATVSFRMVDNVRDPKSGISTPARFVVEAGDPGAKRL